MLCTVFGKRNENRQLAKRYQTRPAGERQQYVITCSHSRISCSLLPFVQRSISSAFNGS